MSQIAATPKKRFRQTLQDLWTEHATEIETALLEAIKQDKPTRAQCTCGKHTTITVPDHTARINAIRVWAEHGFGRPATDTSSVSELASLDEFFRASDDELAAVAHADAAG